METYTGLDDPRMYPTREELPTTFEGAKKFPLWNAQLIDLNELPLEEYMKPMPVNVVSGGTGPGPTPPTPSGETTYFAVKFEASGKTYGSYQIESGTTVPEDDVPIPSKDGYTFSGWTPDPATTVITAATNFNGWFIETVENAYYTLIMVPAGSEFTESGLQSCNVAEFAGGKTIGFEIPLDEEYAAMYQQYEEGEITKQEWKEFLANWEANHLYVIRVAVPVNKEVTSASDGYNELAISGPTTVTVEGVKCRCYEISDEQFFPIEDTQIFNITITIG